MYLLLIFTFEFLINLNAGMAHKGYGAVVSNCEYCADVGGQILNAGGSAVDAAIATLICEGVILPQSLGLGGGFIGTIYTKATGRVETVLARETAPEASDQNMFIHKNITGALSTAIPGEILGYARMHELYGKLMWRELFEPSIDLCMNGHRVSKHLANTLNLHAERILSEITMAENFINPQTNQLFKEGETIFRPRLGETLRILAEEGPCAIYGPDGIIGRKLVEDIQDLGGIITERDLQNYDVRWEEPIVIKFRDEYSIYTTPLPTSGAILAFILNVLDGYVEDDNEVSWQRVIETFKHAYGYRSHLGDINFEPKIREILDKILDPNFAKSIRSLIKDDMTFDNLDHYGAEFGNVDDSGTANIAVLAPNGDAIVITSTVNSHFGAKVCSRQTGIILNDEMDDFSTPGKSNFYSLPASPANFIKPGKVPMSSTCPCIILDKNGDLKMLVGGAGGSKITTSIAQSILRYLVFSETIESSVNSPRIHHQLVPMRLDVEPRVPRHIIDYLTRIGHELNFLPSDKAFSALTAIGLATGEPKPVCDRRRVGSTVVLYPTNAFENTGT